MSTSTPELSRNLRNLTDEGTAVRTMTNERREQLWRDIVHNARRPRRLGWRPAWALATAVATLAVLVWFVGRAPSAEMRALAGHTSTTMPAGSVAPAILPRAQARVVHLGSRADLALRSDAEVTLPRGSDADEHGPYRVRLEHGELFASVGHRDADEPLAVETPDLAVVVVGTRFSVEVAGGLTSVAVEEGRVRIERGMHTLLLSAGEAIRSDDPRLNDSGSALGCSGVANRDQRRTCLRRVADGHGLAAENALFALGLLERESSGERAQGIAHFREYLRRFPSGALTPEVALALSAALAAQDQHEQACAVAADFVRRFPQEQATHERLLRICGR